MEDEDETAAVGKPEFVEACVSFLRRGLENGYYIYWLAEQGRDYRAYFRA